jgi:hypothetical protein
VEGADGRLVDVTRAIVSHDSERSKPSSHLCCRFTREGDRQHTRRVDASLGDSPSDSVGEYASLSRTCAGVHDGGGFGTRDCSSLVVVKVGEQRR